MNKLSLLPSFDEKFADLDRFIFELVKDYQAGKINSWEALEAAVKKFYTARKMDEIESKAPGWKKMSSYSDGITLTHVSCVFMGMYMLPEFLALSNDQQQIAKWIVLFHDIDKVHIWGKKDSMHAFNSAVVAANTLPSLGFFITDEYQEQIGKWSDLVRFAYISTPANPPRPDNQKLPQILSGIDSMFGANSPAALIVKTTLLHISLATDKNYPTPSPLNQDEIKRYIDLNTLPLLKVMYLSDNEGWAIFDPDNRNRQKQEALEAFALFEKIIRAQ